MVRNRLATSGYRGRRGTQLARERSPPCESMARDEGACARTSFTRGSELSPQVVRIRPLPSPRHLLLSSGSIKGPRRQATKCKDLDSPTPPRLIALLRASTCNLASPTERARDMRTPFVWPLRRRRKSEDGPGWPRAHGDPTSRCW